MQGECNSKAGKRSFTGLDTAEPKLILCKDNASERKESLLFISRAQLILCKNKQNISYAEIISHKNNRTTTLCKQLLKNN